MTGIVPLDWRRANVVPIFKKGTKGQIQVELLWSISDFEPAFLFSVSKKQETPGWSSYTSGVIVFRRRIGTAILKMALGAFPLISAENMLISQNRQFTIVFGPDAVTFRRFRKRCAA